MLPSRTTRATVAAALASMVLAACSSGPGRITANRATDAAGSTGADKATTTTTAASTRSQRPSVDGQELSWQQCDLDDLDLPEGGSDVVETGKVECATLEVPLDADDPTGRTVEIGLSRTPATGSSSQRRGTLVVNPGGPGGSGMSFAALAKIGFPAEITSRYDIVGFDPRGLGASDPIECLSADRREEIVETESPEDPAAAAALGDAVAKEIAEGCRSDDAELFERMGTSYVVDDLDAIRAALGEDRLNYLGLSYGTRIGAVYADRYPNRVGAFVLDGAVSPDPSLQTMGVGQATGIVRAYQAFLASCSAMPSCPIGDGPAQTVDALAARLEADPVTYSGTSGSEHLDRDRFLTGILTSLYDVSASVPAMEAIGAVAGSDPERRALGASFLGGLADQQSGREADGTYGNSFEVQGIVNCADSTGPMSDAESAAVDASIKALGGTMAEFLAEPGSNCRDLPSGESPSIVTASSAADRILVVGTAGDPATPIEWATGMANALGGAALLTYEGAGHTASLHVACVTEQVVGFLEDARVSAQTCPTDPDAGDPYLALAEQIERLGLKKGIGRCIADSLRGKADVLEIFGPDADPSPEVIAMLQDAMRRCAAGR